MSHAQKVKLLYKTILKLHRGLPKDLQILGTNYVKDEFKKHIKCKPDEAKAFMHEWTVYTLTLAEQLGLRGPQQAKPLGKNLPPEKLDHLRDEQIVQLYELKITATNDSSEKQEKTK